MIKNIVLNSLLLLVSMFSCSQALQAQKIAFPLGSYETWDKGDGIWDKGDGIKDDVNPKADFVIGIEVGANLADFNPIMGNLKFNFSLFQRILNKEANHFARSFENSNKLFLTVIKS